MSQTKQGSVEAPIIKKNVSFQNKEADFVEMAQIRKSGAKLANGNGKPPVINLGAAAAAMDPALRSPRNSLLKPATGSGTN